MRRCSGSEEGFPHSRSNNFFVFMTDTEIGPEGGVEIGRGLATDCTLMILELYRKEAG